MTEQTWHAFRLSDLCMTLWEQTRDRLPYPNRPYVSSKQNYALVADKESAREMQRLLTFHNSLAAEVIHGFLEQELKVWDNEN